MVSGSPYFWRTLKPCKRPKCRHAKRDHHGGETTRSVTTGCSVPGCDCKQYISPLPAAGVK